MSPETVVVLLSGGLDSTVCMAETAAAGSRPLALTIDYGQRHDIELRSAAAVADHYSAEHLVVSFDAGAWGGSALTDSGVALPQTGTVSETGIPATYVPARNIIFLAMAASVAEARSAAAVCIGVNALDYSGYPDCRPEFIAAFAQLLGIATKRGVDGDPVQLRTPLQHLRKSEIVRRGLALDAPLQLTWSCYAGEQRPCGRCESCVLRARGFAEAGVADPAL